LGLTGNFTLFADAAATAAGVQLTFDARGLRTTGYFLDFDGDRIVDAVAVD